MKRRRIAAGATLAIIVMVMCATVSGPNPTETSRRAPSPAASVPVPTMSQAQWKLEILHKGMEILALLEAPVITTDSRASVGTSQGCTAPQSKGHGYEVVGVWPADIPADRRTTALANVHASWVYQHGYGIDYIQTGFLGGRDPATGIRMRIDATRTYEPVKVEVRSPCNPVESMGTATGSHGESRLRSWADAARVRPQVPPASQWDADQPSPQRFSATHGLGGDLQTERDDQYVDRPRLVVRYPAASTPLRQAKAAQR